MYNVRESINQSGDVFEENTVEMGNTVEASIAETHVSSAARVIEIIMKLHNTISIEIFHDHEFQRKLRCAI